MVAPTEYTDARTELIAQVTKYTNYTRTYITPLPSITGLVVDGVVTGFDTEATAHEATSPTAEEDYAFYTPQTEKLIKLKNSVNGSLIYEIELDLLTDTDLLYFSGVPDPITQDASSIVTQSFEMSTTTPSASELSLETTNIPATYASAVNIAKYNTPTTYFTTDERSLTIKAGVWKTELDIVKGSESDYPLFYTQLVEVGQDGNDLSPPVVIATGTENLAIPIKKSGEFYHYLNVPEHTLSSTLNRLQLKFYAYSSSNTTSFTYKIKGVGLSNVKTTVPTPYVDPLRGPSGPTGPAGVSGGLILYMDSPDVTQTASSITANNPVTQQILKDPDVTATTSITTTNITTTPVNIATYMTSSSFFTELNVPGGLWSFELNGHSPNNDKVEYYINLKEYQSDGTTLVDTIVTGSSDHAVVVGSQNIYVYQIYINPYILESLNSRLAIEIWALTSNGSGGGGGSGSLIIDHRNSTLTNVITTLSQFEGATGPTGATGATGPTGATGADGSAGIGNIDGDLGSSQSVTGSSTVNFAGGSGSGLNLKTTATAYPIITSATTNRVTLESNSITRDAYDGVVGNDYMCQVLYAAASPGYCHVEFKKTNDDVFFAGLIQDTESPLASDTFQFPDMYSIQSAGFYRVVYGGTFNVTSIVANYSDLLSVTYDGSAGTITFKANGVDMGFKKTGLASNLVFHAKFEQYLYGLPNPDLTPQLVFTDILVRETSTAVNTLTTVVDSGTLQQSHGGTGVNFNKAGDGRLLIGSTNGDASLQNLTAGDNITITNEANKITIAAPSVPVGVLNMAYDHPAGTYSHKKLSADWQTIDQLFLLFTPTQTAVECELTFFISDSSNGAHVNVALSGHASEYQFNEWTVEYPTTTTTTTDFLVEQQPYYMRETTTVRWILKGLTPGTQYRATPAMKCPNSPSIYPDLRWGGDSSASYFYRLPPLVFKIKDIDDSWGTGGGSGELPGGSGDY